MSDLTERQREYLDALPQPSYQAWADAVGASESSAEEMRRRLTDENRASGTSKQANADLVLYKSIRNAIAAVIKFGEATPSRTSTSASGKRARIRTSRSAAASSAGTSGTGKTASPRRRRVRAPTTGRRH